MTAIAAFSITPLGGPGASDDGSVGEAVAEVVALVRQSGLAHETNAMFTNVEGDLADVLDLIRRCTEHAAARAPRVSVVVKLDVRPGRVGGLQAKVDRVQQLLSHHPPQPTEPRRPAQG